MEVLIVVMKIGAVMGLVLLNGFFVAAEFAIVKVRATQIEPIAQSGSRRGKLAKHVITHLDAYLSATQLGITLASLGLGWLGEPFVAQLIEPAFAFFGMTQPALIHTVAFAVAFAIITFLHIVLGELAPKSFAIQRAQVTTLLIARPLHLFFVVFRPFIWALNETASFFLRLVGMQPTSESDMAQSEEELRLILSQGRSISTLGKSISLRAMDLKERSVREVMVPRTEICFLNAGKSLEENLVIARENQYTRYPLCDKDLDHVLGMVHIKDLFKRKGMSGPGTALLEIKRDVLFVPETTPLEKMLSTFLVKRSIMAIAVDEHGGTAGLVTLENVLEELVGEIRDEFDTEPSMVEKVRDGEYLIDGSMPLHDFARMFEIEPDTKEVVTVSGFVLQLLGRVPERHASVTMEGWKGTIDSVDGRKVKTLRIRKQLAAEKKK
ncbi:MAG TPA: hemolysin family protein [Bacteroidota bacterium]